MSSGKRGRLRRNWQRIKHVPGFKRDIAVLCVLLLLAVLSGGYILSQQRMTWPWETEFRLTATFDSAPAVSPGNGQEVRIAGVNVGEIRETAVSRRGQALLSLTISPQHKIYRNAKVVLRPKSALNDMYIELDPGGPPAKPLLDGGTLPASAARAPVQVDEVLSHLDGNTRSALTTLLAESDTALASAPSSLPKGLRATDGVVKNLRPVVEQMQTRKDALKKLVNALSIISTTVGNDDSRLAELAANMQRTLGSLGKRSDAFDSVLEQLPDLTKKLQDATGSVQSLSDQLDPTLESVLKASGRLPGSLSKLSSTVDQLGETVDTAKPVVAKARPVVDDLRPFVGDANLALADFKASTVRLDQLTSYSLPWLDDLQAFVYNTRSIFALKDGNNRIDRGYVVFAPQTVTGLLGLTKQFPALLPQSGEPPAVNKPKKDGSPVTPAPSN